MGIGHIRGLLATPRHRGSLDRLFLLQDGDEEAAGVLQMRVYPQAGGCQGTIKCMLDIGVGSGRTSATGAESRPLREKGANATGASCCFHAETRLGIVCNPRMSRTPC